MLYISKYRLILVLSVLNISVLISKHKNNFAKGYTPNQSGEIFVIKKIKNAVPWTYVISDLNMEEIVETFFKKKMQKKTITKSLELKK